MTFIDTLYVIAGVNRRDKFHGAARAPAQRYEREPLITMHAVLMQIGNSLAREFQTQAIQIIEEFYRRHNVELVHVTPELFDKGFALYRKFDDKQWGLVDCISFVVMRERGMVDALTFDQHDTQAGFNALMRDTA